VSFKAPREPILKDIYMPRWPVSKEHFQNTLALLQTPLKLETPFKNLAPHSLFRIKLGCPEESGYLILKYSPVITKLRGGVGLVFWGDFWVCRDLIFAFF